MTPELMGCLGCDAVYTVGLPACPGCGTRSPRYEEVEDQVPKATSAGASNAYEDAPVAEEKGTASAAPVQDAAPTVELHGEHGPELADLPVGDTVVPVAATADVQDAEPLTATDVAAGYTELSFAQLRAEAKARGLSASGGAAELAGRLAEHDTAGAAAQEGAVT